MRFPVHISLKYYIVHIILSLADKTCDWERTKRLNGVSKSQYDRVTFEYVNRLHLEVLEKGTF